MSVPRTIATSRSSAAASSASRSRASSSGAARTRAWSCSSASASVAQHQTGHNSGVVHAGIYYAPGSLKARLCVEGARELYEYCEERGIPFERRGKLIVARDDGELGRLDELERRGRENRVPGLRRLDADGLREIEPHARGVAALHSPETGVVDFAEVARSLAADLERDGGQVQPGCEVTDIERRDGRVRLVHSHGETRARFAVFCAGVWADELAVKAGADPDPRIVPFRGAYLRLRPEKTELVRGLIYPVPNPELPFLGVHLSRHIDGNVSLGPSALLAPTRLSRSLRWPGTWRMAARWWRTGVARAHARRQQPQLRPRGRRLRTGARARRLQPLVLRRQGAGSGPRRRARGRLRALGDRASPPRAKRPVARGHLIPRPRSAHRGPGGAGT